MSNFLILGSDSYVGQCLIEIFKKNKISFETFNKKLSNNINNFKSYVDNYDKFEVIIYLIHDHSNSIYLNLNILSSATNSLSENQKFIFISSSQVIEDNQNNYTKVKKKCEEYLNELTNKNIFILRPSLMIYKKLNKSGIKEQFLITLIKFIYQIRIAMNINYGHFFLNLVSIKDIFNILLIIKDNEHINKKIILNVCQDKQIEFNQILNILSNRVNFVKIPIPIFVLTLLSKFFPKKVPKDSLLALKTKNLSLKSNLLDIDYKLQFKYEDIISDFVDSL
jgi:nucleoside-diphosphate-sugar epimerase